MALEMWQLVAGACTAVGALSLLTRQALRVLSEVQIRELARDSQALQRWWLVIADLPADVLTPELRRTIGRIMRVRLACAGRLQPQHACLREQHRQIARFVEQHPVRLGRIGGRARREELIAGLRALLALLRDSDEHRFVPAAELAAAEGSVSRQIIEMEFLQTQQSTLPADYLRRMTRALSPGNVQGSAQAR